MKRPAACRIFCFILSLHLASCNSVGVFEKHVSFKNQQWDSAYKPNFTFTVTDTTAYYNIFLVLRHTYSYGYNNIWIKFTRTGPDTSYAQQVDLQLANNAQGWLGTGMDDIWEHRIPVTQSATRFRKPGDYSFTLQQVMREDPLQHVLNVGVRVEKIN